ncbi:type IX secretion system anionic LPS delivery protein PorZ [Mangrovimonas xylaniphaga]|uniref:type IX secretion system anionic LPS delivery protein PorZ n=1 Tax=Mangrovimonas xylaniphaga TaxID=1645915 RepID=UPI0006B4BB9A|nr:two-component regulator propeller domain-containing protein [Mangrovimonas xylaniphaga]
MKPYFYVYILACLFCFKTSLAQDFSTLWQGHFSYLDIKDFSKGEDHIYVASDNAIFIYDINFGTIEEITTVNGLSGESISTIHYSEAFDELLIGYENGLVEVLSNNFTEVTTVIDILNKPTIPTNIKRINHFNEHDGYVYIATDFGISEYDLENLEFGDTFYVGIGSSHIKVYQTTISNGFIYAACGDNNAIKIGDLSNPNLIDYTQWETLGTGSFVGIEQLGNNLYAFKSNKIAYEILNGNLNSIFTYPQVPLDMRSDEDNLVVTTNSQVYLYSDGFVQTGVVDAPAELTTSFTSGIVDYQNNVYAGTKGILSSGKPGHGVLKMAVSAPEIYDEIHPQGPLLNNIFSIQTPSNEIWTVFGGYSSTYNFNGGKARTGVSHFKNEQWINTPYDTIAAVVSNPNYLSHIAVNPINRKQVYISSYSAGLIEINNDQVIQVYNQDNSTITPFAGNSHLTLSGAFENDGTLWLTNGRVESPLNKFSDDQWTSFDFTSIIDAPLENIGFSSTIVDSQGNVFFGSYYYGVLGFNENGGNNFMNFVASEEENMPSTIVRSLALDNNNQLWIGTERGLRVMYNPGSFVAGSQANVHEIVILQDGLAEELLVEQTITSIQVDGSNNKWIGTLNSGVFYFSPDGQETIYHFTKSNSPLPSNAINDISIDSENGRVYFATSNGLVSFLAGGSKSEEELDDAFVYPNPVRPEYNILGFDDLNNITKGVKIKGLTENVNIKITDIEGNLVAEAQSRVNQRTSRAGYNFAIDGGTAIWNGKNLANNVVATGVYLIMISDLDSFETKVLKLLIVR